MKRKALAALVMGLVASSLVAATSIVTDPTTMTTITHCAWYMDASARQLVPAPKDDSGKPFCKLDVSSLASGSHTVKAAFVIVDPAWGEREGPQSVPFAFANPAAPTASPTGLKVSP